VLIRGWEPTRLAAQEICDMHRPSWFTIIIKNACALRNILSFYSSGNIVKIFFKKTAALVSLSPFLRFGSNRFRIEENIMSLRACGATRRSALTLSMIAAAWGREIGVHAARKRTEHSFQWKTTSRPEITSIYCPPLPQTHSRLSSLLLFRKHLCSGVHLQRYGRCGPLISPAASQSLSNA
jgi:hypothetical protein